MNQCPNCGNIVNNQMYNSYNNQIPYQPVKKTCIMAIISFILGMFSFLCLILTSIPALILGLVSLKKIDKNNLGGKAYAIAGIILSIISMIITVFLIIFNIVLPALYKDVPKETIIACCESSHGRYDYELDGCYSEDDNDDFDPAGYYSCIFHSKYDK